MTWDQLTTIQKVDLWVIHGMLLGQIIFVVLWATLPFWKEWVGRALMVKSAAFAIVLTVTVVNFWLLITHGPSPMLERVALASHFLVLFGIWFQAAALAYEMRKGRRIPKDET